MWPYNNNPRNFSKLLKLITFGVIKTKLQAIKTNFLPRLYFPNFSDLLYFAIYQSLFQLFIFFNAIMCSRVDHVGQQLILNRMGPNPT